MYIGGTQLAVGASDIAVVAGEHDSALIHEPAVDAQTSCDPYPHTGLHASFPAQPDAPGQARRLVVAALQRWGYEDVLVGDVALIVSELASNAVRHAASPFALVVRVEDAIVNVSVRDYTPPLATAPNGGLTSRPLHGLGLIDAIAARWEVMATPDGKVVSAQLPCHAPVDAQR